MIPYLMEIENRSEEEAKEYILDLLEIEDEKQIKFEVIGKSKIGRLIKRQPLVVRGQYAGKEIPQELLIRSIIYNILEKMEIEAEIIEMRQEGKIMHVNIESEQSAFIIGKKGRMLDTIQFIVNLLTHLNAKNEQRIIINVSGYRERRKETIESIATKVKEHVIKINKSRMLDFMNPYERRIVHMYLENDKKVSTESIGKGLYKRVKIFLIDNNQAGNEGIEENEDQVNDGNIIQDDTEEIDGNLA